MGADERDEDEGLEIDSYCKIQRSQVWGYKVPSMLDISTTVLS